MFSLLPPRDVDHLRLHQHIEAPLQITHCKKLSGFRTGGGGRWDEFELKCGPWCRYVLLGSGETKIQEYGFS